MKTALKIYLRAQAAYALLTLPALILFPMYFISLFLAISWGTAGLALFLPVIPLLRGAQLRMSGTALLLVWIAGMGATFAATWLACSFYEENRAPLNAMLEWWPFPLVAYIATTIAVIWERRRIVETVCGETPFAEPAGYNAPL